MDRNPFALCSSCPFFFKEEAAGGTCRFNAPAITVPGGIPFALVADDSTCGRHPEFFEQVTTAKSSERVYMGSKKESE